MTTTRGAYVVPRCNRGLQLEQKKGEGARLKGALPEGGRGISRFSSFKDPLGKIKKKRTGDFQGGMGPAISSGKSARTLERRGDMLFSSGRKISQAIQDNACPTGGFATVTLRKNLRLLMTGEGIEATLGVNLTRGRNNGTINKGGGRTEPRRPP